MCIKYYISMILKYDIRVSDTVYRIEYNVTIQIFFNPFIFFRPLKNNYLHRMFLFFLVLKHNILKCINKNYLHENIIIKLKIRCEYCVIYSSKSIIFSFETNWMKNYEEFHTELYIFPRRVTNWNRISSFVFSRSTFKLLKRTRVKLRIELHVPRRFDKIRIQLRSVKLLNEMFGDSSHFMFSSPYKTKLSLQNNIVIRMLYRNSNKSNKFGKLHFLTNLVMRST